MQIENFIAGEHCRPVKGQYMDNINPSTGEVYGKIPLSTEEDIDRAVQAAAEAFAEWKKAGPSAYSKYLHRIADAIEENLEMLAMAESTDNGKPLGFARSVDIPRAAENFRFFAQAATQFASEAHPMPYKAINYTLRQPLGPVACISPWNLPLYLLSWKIAPALASGNTVVAKPSEVTPATAFLLGKIVEKSGLPKGVLNIVHGTGPQTGGPLVNHPKIKAVSFTGGTATGATIASQIAPKFKKMSLELGGKNATIVFDDCHYETMLSHTVRAAFSNQGQICLCGSRILVQRPIYDKFLNDFIAKTKKLRLGDPLEENTQIGAVVSEAHRDKILQFIQAAKEEGGDIVLGGDLYQPEGRCSHGFFVNPTIVTNLSTHCRTNQEEIFGPVVTLMPFDTEEEALAMANSTRYGLSCSLWTQNIGRAHQMAENLETGIVWINTWLLRDLRTPFGGTKDSGVGREGGWEAMRFFTEPKNVCIQYGI
jgi:aminomuconate-semialdehyde/2-hydroxymuconate-6-semialdehyde dehydrogenase